MQFTSFRKYSAIFTIISSISIGIILVSTLVLLVTTITVKPNISLAKLITKEPTTVLAAIFFLGYFPSFYITDWLKKLWPNIEIQIGPKHNFVEENRRKLLVGIFVIVIIPLVISFLVK